MSKKRYEIAEPEVYAEMRKVLEEHHSELREAHASVCLLAVYGAQPGVDEDEDEDEDVEDDRSTRKRPLVPVLKLHGRPCAAIVRIVSVRDRAKGCADIEIQYDAAVYETLDSIERKALWSHELEHVEIVEWFGPDKNRKPKLDAAERPKLKMKLHDIFAEGFKAILDRFGPRSIDAKQIRGMLEECGQYRFIFDGEPVSKIVRMRGGRR